MRQTYIFSKFVALSHLKKAWGSAEIDKHPGELQAVEMMK